MKEISSEIGKVERFVEKRAQSQTRMEIPSDPYAGLSPRDRARALTDSLVKQIGVARVRNIAQQEIDSALKWERDHPESVSKEVSDIQEYHRNASRFTMERLDELDHG